MQPDRADASSSSSSATGRRSELRAENSNDVAEEESIDQETGEDGNGPNEIEVADVIGEAVEIATRGDLHGDRDAGRQERESPAEGVIGAQVSHFERVESAFRRTGI